MHYANARDSNHYTKTTGSACGSVFISILINTPSPRCFVTPVSNTFDVSSTIATRNQEQSSLTSFRYEVDMGIAGGGREATLCTTGLSNSSSRTFSYPSQGTTTKYVYIRVLVQSLVTKVPVRRCQFRHRGLSVFLIPKYMSQAVRIYHCIPNNHGFHDGLTEGKLSKAHFAFTDQVFQWFFNNLVDKNDYMYHLGQWSKL